MSVIHPALLRSPPDADDEGNDEAKQEVVLGLSHSSKFGITWPSDAISPTFSPGDSPAVSAQGETKQGWGISSGASLPFSKDTPDDNFRSALRSASQRKSRLPRFSRSSSMALPSQLGRLRNPCRSPSSSWRDVIGRGSQLREVSLELADSVQAVVQTLLRVAPPQLLDPVKEQFSACSLCVPTPSISAMLTSMKNLNYISAHMDTLSSEISETSPPDGNGPVLLLPSAGHNDLDIGEMLQSIGDALSGAAAKIGVDLVLYHGDVGMKHVYVRGDEGGISFALSHVSLPYLYTISSQNTLGLPANYKCCSTW
jgi:osomolarity two-component system response regulator SSK1